MTTVFYTSNRELNEMSTQGIAAQLLDSTSTNPVKRKAGRPRHKSVASNAGDNTTNTKDTQMNPTTETNEAASTNEVATKSVQRTVFDLTAFDDLKLTKEVALPAKPTSIQEALAAVENSTPRLLEIIYEGLIADATSKAWDQIEGFHIVNEDGEAGELYTGKYADEAKGKLINAAILSLAKMQGYDKNLSREKKRELKEKATEFLRSNPAMLQSIQG
jgi:hypothetical protein